MRRVSLEYHRRIRDGEIPVVYSEIHTPLGVRMYSDRPLAASFIATGFLADGSVLADGSTRAGVGSSVLTREPRVMRHGRCTRTTSSSVENRIVGSQSKRQGSYSVDMTNADRELGRLFNVEPFILQPVVVRSGFLDMDSSQHTELFRGAVDEIVIRRDTVTFTAVEV